MNKSNVIATTKGLTVAKAKAPTKAERLRTNLTKANASAAKRLALGKDESALIAQLVDDTKKQDGSARTFAAYMNNQFAEPMKAFRCHWSAFTSANCRSDNEKAILNRVEALRKQVQELAIAKGLTGYNKPWSDMRKIAVEMFHGGAPRERKAIALDVRQEKSLAALYKAGMKEERQTEREANLNIAIGELLVAYFKTDLSKLG